MDSTVNRQWQPEALRPIQSLEMSSSKGNPVIKGELFEMYAVSLQSCRPRRGQCGESYSRSEPEQLMAGIKESPKYGEGYIQMIEAGRTEF
jgi:hypothetical protein